MTGNNSIARVGLDADAILVIVGGTLVCAGGLALAHSPRVQNVVRKLVMHPHLREAGRAAIANALRAESPL